MNPDVPAHNATLHGLQDKPPPASPQADPPRYAPDITPPVRRGAIRQGRAMLHPAIAPSHLSISQSIEGRDRLNHAHERPSPWGADPPFQYHRPHSLGRDVGRHGAAARSITWNPRVWPTVRRGPPAIRPASNSILGPDSPIAMHLSVIASRVDSLTHAKGLSLSPSDSFDSSRCSLKNSNLKREPGKVLTDSRCRSHQCHNFATDRFNLKKEFPHKLHLI